MIETNKNHIARLYHLHAQMERELAVQRHDLAYELLDEGLPVYAWFAGLIEIHGELEAIFAEVLTEAERDQIQTWPDVGAPDKL